MQKRPADRYQSVDEMLDALARVRDRRNAVLCHLTFLKRLLGATDHALDRYPRLMTGLVSLLLLGMIYAVWLAAAALVGGVARG